MFQAVLFELEGVLADTRNFRQRALQETFAHDGVLIPDSVDGVCAGLPVRSAVVAAFRSAGIDADETAVDLMTLRVERQFAEHLAHGFVLREGSRELIAHLAGRVRLGLVTRASRNEADAMLSLAGLEFAFECVVTGDHVASCKPSPEPYLAALRVMSRLRPLAAGYVLALEDGPTGIQSARGAGVRCLAVGALPAHHAMQAEGLLPTLRGHTLVTIEDTVLRPEERIA